MSRTNEKLNARIYKFIRRIEREKGVFIDEIKYTGYFNSSKGEKFSSISSSLMYFGKTPENSISDDNTVEFTEKSDYKMSEWYYIAKKIAFVMNSITSDDGIDDIGNEIGIVIGNFIHDDKKMDEAVNDFIYGLKHGIELTRETNK